MGIYARSSIPRYILGLMRDFAVGISIVSEYAGGVSGQGMVRLFQAHTLALANGWFFLVTD